MSVGTVTKLNGIARVIRDNVEVLLKDGDNILLNDDVFTDNNTQMVITFKDETQLTLADNANMIIDEMVYDPATQDGSMSLSLLQGAATVLSGAIAKVNPDAMEINTPVATIGIRGTMAAILVLPNGQTKVVNLPEPDGSVGEIGLTNQFGTQILNQLLQGLDAEQGVALGSPTIRSPSEVLSSFNDIIVVNVVDGKIVSVVKAINPGAVQDNVDELDGFANDGSQDDTDEITEEPVSEEPVVKPVEEPEPVLEQTLQFEEVQVVEIAQIIDIVALVEAVEKFEETKKSTQTKETVEDNTPVIQQLEPEPVREEIIDPPIDEGIQEEPQVEAPYTIVDYGGYMVVDFIGGGTYDGSSSTSDQDVYGDANANIILTGAGNDYIMGYAGNDIINAGSGYAYIDGGDGHDTLIINDISINFDVFQAGGLAIDNYSDTTFEVYGIETIQFNDATWNVDESFGYTVTDTQTQEIVYSSQQML